jgi:hypothetical protein
MEPLEIVIPSMDRAGSVITHNYIEGCIIVVPESQEYAYRKAHPELEVVTHPDSVKGLPPKLEWIRRYFSSNLFFVDDDCKGIYRLWDFKNTRLTPTEARDLIIATAHTARAAGCYLFGFNKNPRPETYNFFQPIQMSGYVLGGATGLLTGSKLYWNTDMKILGDYWISLLNAYYHRKAFIDNRFCFQFKDTFTSSGGLASIRNKERIKEHVELLRKCFGDAIKEKEKKGFHTPRHEYEINLNLPF